jgi:hypothetical protein
MSANEPAVTAEMAATAVEKNRSARTRMTVIGLVILVAVIYCGFILMMVRH